MLRRYTYDLLLLKTSRYVIVVVLRQKRVTRSTSKDDETRLRVRVRFVDNVHEGFRLNSTITVRAFGLKIFHRRNPHDRTGKHARDGVRPRLSAR